jgi:hypothetical protein
LLRLASGAALFIGDAAMIGNPHFTLVHAPALYTVHGMADFADLSLMSKCGDCVHFSRKAKGAAQGRCLEFARRMQGREGAVLRASQQACRAFKWATTKP